MNEELRALASATIGNNEIREEGKAFLIWIVQEPRARELIDFDMKIDGELTFRAYLEKKLPALKRVLPSPEKPLPYINLILITFTLGLTAIGTYLFYRTSMQKHRPAEPADLAGLSLIAQDPAELNFLNARTGLSWKYNPAKQWSYTLKDPRPANFETQLREQFGNAFRLKGMTLTFEQAPTVIYEAELQRKASELASQQNQGLDFLRAQFPDLAFSPIAIEVGAAIRRYHLAATPEDFSKQLTQKFGPSGTESYSFALNTETGTTTLIFYRTADELYREQMRRAIVKTTDTEVSASAGA